MGFLATILTTLLVGGGYMINLQFKLSADNSEFRELLKQHSAQLLTHEQRLAATDSDRVAVVDIKAQMKAIQDIHVASTETLNRRIDGQDERLQSHTHAIVTAEGLLNGISAKITEVVSEASANKVWHDAVNRRVEAAEKAIERLESKRR